MKLKDLVPDPHNANRGTERGRAMLEDSLKQYGAGRSILVDKHGRVIAGNKTLETAIESGFTDVEVIQTDGKKIVAVQRVDLDLLKDDSARQLAYADNRVSEVDLEFDTSKILEDLDRGLDFSGLWSGEELDKMLHGKSEEKPEKEFTQELLEEHNYIVLYFDNSADWLAAQETFGIETVQSLKNTSDYEHSRGVGRVIRGDNVVRRLNGGG